MGGELSALEASALAVYSICCGVSEQSIHELEHESKENNASNPKLVFEANEEEKKGLLSQSSSDALDSFLKHQFSELTPEIIKAQGLDPINKIWRDEIRGLVFKASVQLGPLTNLSNLVFDTLDMDDINVRYTETLHSETGMHLSIKIREPQTVNLGLAAQIGINPRGDIMDVSVPAKGSVHCHGLRVQCSLALKHSLDLEWNDRSKSIEGTLANDITLGSVEVDYDHITVHVLSNNVGDEITPVIWSDIEVAISNTVTTIFKRQIAKLLTKVFKIELEKVLKQINKKVPKFDLSFNKHVTGQGIADDVERKEEQIEQHDSDDIVMSIGPEPHTNKFINLFEQRLIAQ